MVRPLTLEYATPSPRWNTGLVAIVRLVLLIVYVVFSWGVSLFFIRSDGFGSHAPAAILFSWGILPSEYGLVSKTVLIVPAFYLLSLFALATACARWHPAFSFFPFLIHGVGIVLALLAVTRHTEHGADATPGFMRASYFIAALLAGAYLLFDGWMARSPRGYR
jgi:hypothetical protein